MTKGQLRKLILEALRRERKQLENLKGSSNPQVKEIYYRTDGQINAFYAVLDALNDKPALLNTHVTGLL